MQICEAFVNKYNYATYRLAVSIEKVEQLDDDRILMVRRHQEYQSGTNYSWEQIIFNRQNRTIESSTCGRNPNNTPYIV